VQVCRAAVLWAGPRTDQRARRDAGDGPGPVPSVASLARIRRGRGRSP